MRIPHGADVRRRLVRALLRQGGRADARLGRRAPIGSGSLLAVASLLLGVSIAHAQGAEEIVLYERAGCPHCERAGEWLEDLERRRPSVTVTRKDVVADREARAELDALSERAGSAPIGLPAISARGRLFIGFRDAATSGRAIEAWLDGGALTDASGTEAMCTLEAEAEPCEAIERAPTVPLRWLGELDVEDVGLPLFTIAIGLVDGFNPCAMWVLLLLLSMLAHLRDRARMAWIAGTFVIVSALVYYAFMAAWLEIHLLIGIGRAAQIVLGVFALAVAAVHLKDFVAYGRGPSLSIPESAKPGIYARIRAVLRAENLALAIVMVVALAFLVNLVELLCTAGLPAVYTQILAANALSRAEHFAYLGLYDLAYMADDIVMTTIGVLTLSQRKLQERGGRALKLVSGLVMAALGVLLLVKPEWLLWG